MANSRDAILTRVRQALRVPARAHAPGPPPTPETFRRWLPAVGAMREEWLALFAKNAAELKADFFALTSLAEARAKLRDLARVEGWRKLAMHPGSLTSAATEGLELPMLDVSPGYQAPDLETCDAGLTECDCLVAQTGSLVVTSRSSGGRALSVLPPHHVVLARREQLVPDLPAAFARLKEMYRDSWPSMISFVTGPSRTGDIERILVLGAHGPKKLTILLME